MTQPNPVLNRKMAFAVIAGKPDDGAKIMQFGHRFLADGTYVGKQDNYTAPNEEESEIKKLQDEIIALKRKLSAQAAATGSEMDEKQKEALEEAEKAVDGMGYESMSTAQLKELVKERGGVYTNKQDAIEFLSGEKAA